MNENKSLILIIDDETDWSDILTVNLNKLGYATHAVSDAAQAKAWLASHRPALILLDIMMPDGNGLDLCHWIHAQKEFEPIPIIIDSGIKDDETAQMALELGASFFMRKPIKLEVLKQKIKQLLASKS